MLRVGFELCTRGINMTDGNGANATGMLRTEVRPNAQHSRELRFDQIPPNVLRE